jgi:Ca-activated chloride channel family protein
VRVQGEALPLARAPADARFAAAVAPFGMLLRDSPHRGHASFESVLTLAKFGLGADRNGHRAGFVALVKRARALHVERLAAE